MMRRNESIILATLVCFSAGCILSMIGGTSFVLRDEVMPADTYSNVLAGLLIIACLARLVSINRSVAKQAGDTPVIVLTRSSILIAICSLVYTLGMTNIGFYVSTFVCMFALYLGFENWDVKKMKRGLVFSIGLCLIFYVTFSYMKIYLPDGLLF